MRESNQDIIYKINVKLNQLEPKYLAYIFKIVSVLANKKAKNKRA